MTMRAPASDLPIIFADASVSIGAITILADISLSIGAGTPTVLLGPNGWGKTTLLRAAMGLIPVSGGRVTWAGRKVAPPTRRALLLQRPVMLRRSAGGNLRYALRTAGVPRAEHVRRTAEMLALVGLDGLQDRPARRLSGGEQQRLALARALARDPAVLFLDEPTAGLDPYATKVIEDVVHAITARGVKAVVSTHDLGQAKRIGGEIVLLHRGRIAETASAADFFANPRTREGRRFIAGELLI
jgi:tungstate transport system ATP-binding protein